MTTTSGAQTIIHVVGSARRYTFHGIPGTDFPTLPQADPSAPTLYLPIDVKLLLGMEVGRAENSPFLLDTILNEETSKKYIGGLALNF